MLKIAGGVVLATVASGAAIRAANSTGPRFEISFPASAHAGPITGRVRDDRPRRADRAPAAGSARTGIPFFGRDVDKLAPGQAATIDDTDLGSPIPSLRDLPAGDYLVQAFVNVVRIHLDGKNSSVVKLNASEVIPPVVVPPDTPWVKRFKFQSPMLTKFWGRPIYLGAVVLVPRDYARETVSYAVNYSAFGLHATA